MAYEQINGNVGIVDSYGRTFGYGSKWGWQVTNKLRNALIALCSVRIYLGGNRYQPVVGTGLVEAWNWEDWEPVFGGFFSHTFDAEMRSEDAGTGIVAVLRDETANSIVWTSGAVTSSSWTRTGGYTFTPVPGHKYRAYFQKANDNAQAYGGKAWIDRL